MSTAKGGRLAPWACMIALCACGPERPPPAPAPDGSVRRDGGSFDAGPIRRRDAGHGPTLDGLVGEVEWAGATSARSDVESDRAGSTLSRLLAVIEDGKLFVAVEGTLASGDALVVYVDRDLGAGLGRAPGELADVDGTLDFALTQPALIVPDALRMDLAWGTTRGTYTAVGLDDAAGWRDLTGSASRFAWIAAEEAPSVCTDGGCETAIPLALLGGSAPRTIALFARIVRAEGGLTNQTLPQDDAARPGTVSALLTLEDGVRDGGAGDAGVDAGPPRGIVIDGVIGADEWAAALVERNTVSATGIFAGSALESVRALRDEARIYVAIEGALGPSHAILMYVDHDVGGSDGLVSPTPLEDGAGALDRALSKMLFTPAELRIDFAWGTTQMSRVAAATDDRMGWREIASRPDVFRAIDGASAPSACSARACETSIDLSTLGVLAGAEVGLFVRLASATTLAFSNQTLPMDNPAAPETVDVYMLLR